jgi:hypothetical protein
MTSPIFKTLREIENSTSINENRIDQAKQHKQARPGTTQTRTGQDKALILYL